MVHQPFDEWLSADHPLTEEQERLLQEHLRLCADCAARYDVERILRTADLVAPAPGFTARFQARLAQRRVARRRRGVVGFLLLAAGVLGPLISLLWPYAATILRSPASLLSAWVQYLAFLASLTQAIGRAAFILLRVFSDLVSPVSGLMFLTTAIALILLWVLSLWKISQTPQGI